MQLSKNFYLKEFCQSPSAAKFGFEEQDDPPQAVIDNLQLLCQNVLQPLRDIAGRSIEVTSGYRCVRLNDMIGGVKSSQHLEGKAADIILNINGQNKSKLLFDKIIELGLPFCQLIDEKNYSWVHVSYDKDNIKKQILHL